MATEFNYENAMKELEETVAKLSGGSITLDESFQLYSRGMELAAACEKRLNEIEQKIRIINKSTGEEEAFLPERGDDSEGIRV